MIGYRISRGDLEKRITDEARTWLERAATRTEEFRRIGRYNETSSIWSEVKQVYMRLQGDSKCAFCERQLESPEHGKGEQDVEHFRPKGSIRSWRVPKELKDEGVNVTPVSGNRSGYHLLPYDPFNYVAACKPCNSALKRTYFPIAGDYDTNGDDPRRLLREKPYLIYPIGDFDDPPEELIGFYGASPRALVSRGHKRHRALVTIKFFKLDDVNSRKNLIRDRARIIIGLYCLLKEASEAESEAERDALTRCIDGFTAAHAAHANCGRCFREVFQRDPAEAKALWKLAGELIASMS